MAEENFYPDVGTEPPANMEAPPAPAEESEESEEMEEPEESEESESGGETFVVSKSALGGKGIRPGDVISVKAVHVYDDEIEFSVGAGKSIKNKSMSADEEIDAMKD